MRFGAAKLPGIVFAEQAGRILLTYDESSMLATWPTTCEPAAIRRAS